MCTVIKILGFYLSAQNHLDGIMKESNLNTSMENILLSHLQSVRVNIWRAGEYDKGEE